MGGIVQLIGVLVLAVGVALKMGQEYGIPVGVGMCGLFVFIIGVLLEMLEVIQKREVKHGPAEGMDTGEQSARYTTSSTIDAG